jgi:hypothetical protein
MLNPHSAPGLYHRGMLRLNRGKLRQGLDDLSLAVAKDPNGTLEQTARARAVLAAKKTAAKAPAAKAPAAKAPAAKAPAAKAPAAKPRVKS